MDEVRTKFEQILELLDKVMAQGGTMHAAHDFGTGVPLYRSEIHTVQAIGLNRGINVTKLAAQMGVTKGAVSQTVRKLVKKGLAQRSFPENDGRATLLDLTDLGWTAFNEHEAFHDSMFELIQDYFGDQLETKTEMFLIVLRDLSNIFERIEKIEKSK